MLKKIAALSSAVVLSMVFVLVGGSLVAPATHAASASQYCDQLIDAAGFGPNAQGGCTSYFQSHNSNSSATNVFVCRTFFVPAGIFPTQGSCVSVLNSFMK